MFRVVVIPHWSGCYHLSWVLSGQTICVLPGFLKKIIGTKASTLSGSYDLTIFEMSELGFLI